MAQLIQMRQRIKAVETIKKITHAMRLISMSTHSRLRHKKAHFEQYKNTFSTLALAINPPKDALEETTAHKDLVVLVGSQKGLCGAFNVHLFNYFEHDYKTIPQHTDVISIGKHATDYINPRITPILAFNEFNSNTFVSIALTIVDFLNKQQDVYKKVVVYSNASHSFFSQKPQRTQIIPLERTETQSSPTPLTEQYIFEEDQTTLAHTIKQLLLTISLEELLFESLLAEQSARFLSMDASTRNAENLLVEMKLEYNKTRQAAITRELTELASSFA